jgi:hypothetical protein
MPNRDKIMRTHKLVLFGVVVAAVLMLSVPAARAQSIGTGPVTITRMGCGMASTSGSGSACWVYISGPAVGPAGCNGTSIRWDPQASPNGREATAQLTAAFMAGKQVLFVLNDTCWAQWPSFPTIWYYEVLEP